MVLFSCKKGSFEVLLMITIVEPNSFTRHADKLMSKDEKDDLISAIAADPESGDVIPKTGGVRKLRIAREGQGKRGSFRVIYYYYNKLNPVFLFDVFGKNQKANISDADKKAFYQGIQILKKGLKNDKSR